MRPDPPPRVGTACGGLPPEVKTGLLCASRPEEAQVPHLAEAAFGRRPQAVRPRRAEIIP
ncbi:hypothetical protein [Actinomadura sp. HBU206391]|uniref:hypothetical protein n=1 Tax=Actinomadura sp. HBU206391 TaxID=2731692 RepID=UPI00164FC942|nr:hypothetical protein [Actinomadura sp. HBU206391]MBC6463203.1 hypothetical protein [Actinomadura sp. HBU206391]